MKKTKRILMTIPLLIAAVSFMNSANLPAGNVQAASKDTYRAILQAYKRNDYRKVQRLSKTSPIGANGITFLSFLQGAGGARINGKARGTFVGMTLGTRKADMARAVMEGICYEMYDIIRAEEDSGIKIDKIRLAGGAAKSPLWCQMMADIFKH